MNGHVGVLGDHTARIADEADRQGERQLAAYGTKAPVPGGRRGDPQSEVTLHSGGVTELTIDLWHP